MTSGRAALRDDVAHVLRATLHPDLAVARAAWDHWSENADVVDLDPSVLRVSGQLAERLDALGGRETRAARLVLYRARFAWLRSLTLRRRIAPVLRSLADGGVPALLMKGPAVLHHTGAPVKWRPMMDLDLLVDLEDVAAAGRILREHGFTSAFDPAFASAPECFAARHAISFDDGSGGEVDLHWRGSHTARSAAVERRRFEGAVATVMQDAPVLVPRAEDVLVQVVEHGSMLSPRADGAWAADVALLLRDGPPLDWELVVDLSRERRMGTLVREAVERATVVTGVPLPGEGAGALRTLRPTAAQLARRRRAGAGGEARRRPSRLDLALENLEEHVMLAGVRRARPADPLRALARTWHLPSSARASAYAVHVGLGRPRTLRDLCAGAPPHPAADARPLPLHLDVSTAGTPETWPLLRSGWSAPEEFGCWILGDHALVTLPVKAVRGEPLTLDVGAGTFLVRPDRPEVRVTVVVDDVRLGVLRFTGEMPTTTTHLVVPPGVVRGGSVDVRFAPARAISPAQLGIDEDPRRLSAYIRHLVLRRPGALD